MELVGVIASDQNVESVGAGGRSTKVANKLCWSALSTPQSAQKESEAIEEYQDLEVDDENPHNATLMNFLGMQADPLVFYSEAGGGIETMSFEDPLHLSPGGEEDKRTIEEEVPQIAMPAPGTIAPPASIEIEAQVSAHAKMALATTAPSAVLTANELVNGLDRKMNTLGPPQEIPPRAAVPGHPAVTADGTDRLAPVRAEFRSETRRTGEEVSRVDIAAWPAMLAPEETSAKESQTDVVKRMESGPNPVLPVRNPDGGDKQPDSKLAFGLRLASTVPAVGEPRPHVVSVKGPVETGAIGGPSPSFARSQTESASAFMRSITTPAQPVSGDEKTPKRVTDGGNSETTSQSRSPKLPTFVADVRTPESDSKASQDPNPEEKEPSDSTEGRSRVQPMIRAKNVPPTEPDRSGHAEEHLDHRITEARTATPSTSGGTLAHETGPAGKNPLPQPVEVKREIGNRQTLNIPAESIQPTQGRPFELSEVRLKLEPPGLHEVEVRLVDRAGQIQLDVRADDIGTRGLLREGLQDLVSKLEIRGLKPEGVTIAPENDPHRAAKEPSFPALGGSLGDSTREERQQDPPHQQHRRQPDHSDSHQNGSSPRQRKNAQQWAEWMERIQWQTQSIL